MIVEKRQVYGFFFWRARSGFVTTQDLYEEFKRSNHKTKLSLNGFGRLLPKNFKRAVKRIDSKLYRGVIL